MRELVNTEQPLHFDFKVQPISDYLSGELPLEDRQSYHFLAGKRHIDRGGDFTVGISEKSVKLFGSSLHQRGLMDLGNLGDVDLQDVEIPAKVPRHSRVEVVAGHTYVALAKAGEEGHFIVFPVKKITPGESITLQFEYR